MVARSEMEGMSSVFLIVLKKSWTIGILNATDVPELDTCKWLALLKTQIQFPVPTPGSSEPPVSPAPGNDSLSWSHVDTHKDGHTEEKQNTKTDLRQHKMPCEIF